MSKTLDAICAIQEDFQNRFDVNRVNVDITIHHHSQPQGSAKIDRRLADCIVKQFAKEFGEQREHKQRQQAAWAKTQNSDYSVSITVFYPVGEYTG